MPLGGGLTRPRGGGPHYFRLAVPVPFPGAAFALMFRVRVVHSARRAIGKSRFNRWRVLSR
jgi:hypothetical protein